jgi:hypothetical protein
MFRCLDVVNVVNVIVRHNLQHVISYFYAEVASQVKLIRVIVFGNVCINNSNFYGQGRRLESNTSLVTVGLTLHSLTTLLTLNVLIWLTAIQTWQLFVTN